MADSDVRLECLLDSLRDPFVYCDDTHVIRFMNRVARERYAGRPAAVGRSIFDCHNGESHDLIRSVCARLESGEDELLISENDRERVFMRAVRGAAGEFMGYYERYEARG